MTVYICKCLNSTATTHWPAAVQLDLWLCGCLGEHRRSSTSNSSRCNVQLSFMTAIFCESWKREQWDTRPVWGSHANTFNTFFPSDMIKFYFLLCSWRMRWGFTKHSWVSFQISLSLTLYLPWAKICTDCCTPAFTSCVYMVKMAKDVRKFTAGRLKQRFSTSRLKGSSVCVFIFVGVSFLKGFLNLCIWSKDVGHLIYSTHNWMY